MGTFCACKVSKIQLTKQNMSKNWIQSKHIVSKMYI